MLVYNVVLQDGRLPVVSRYFTVKETEVQRVYSGFFHGWKFSLFNFSWVDILAFGATLHRICIVEEILVELILAL